MRKTTEGTEEKRKILCVLWKNILLKEITEKIIGSCIEVHRHLGSGLLESIYEEALSHEFKFRYIVYTKKALFTPLKRKISAKRKGFVVGVFLRLCGF